MRVLFSTFRPPWPPTCGPDNRVWQHLVWLAERHSVTLVTFAPSDSPLVPAPLADVCEGVRYVRLSSWPARVRAIAALSTAEPLQVAYYRSPEIHRVVRELVSGGSWDLLYLNGVRTAPLGIACRSVPRLFDYTDAVSLHLSRRAKHLRGWKRWLYGMEGRRLAAYERRLAQLFEKTIITSRLDAAAIGTDRPPEVVPIAAGQMVDLGSGGETDISWGSSNVAFIGDMRTEYSESAILWFLREVWPAVKRAVPGAVFWVVGREPSPGVRRLAGEDVRVTGTVPSLRPYYDGAQVVVAPLRFGSGIKTKVLEAMAAGLPVVGTPTANEGADAMPNEEILIAEEPAQFAAHVITLLRDPDLRRRVGEAARVFVARRFSLPTVRQRFESAVLEALQARRS